MEPDIIHLPVMKFAGCREALDLHSGNLSEVQQAWYRFFHLDSGLLKHKVRNNQFWGVTSEIDSIPHTYMAGCQVAEYDLNLSTHGIETFETRAQQFARFEHRGHVDNMGETICQAFEWLKQSDFELEDTYILEMYDERCDSDYQESYVVELYFPVQHTNRG
ncbi:Bacterial transcription activator, effector binding domain [Vibrio aerogenes CECT 7868]|uniref:Bacterial transcription activator, effector binding domain n=1 Tax=Vibrio aerogenes CECT 7868 TaxID=1216006 RepID=A0A1M5ZJV1_9VIBR|nr:GyrI-like domain-containing protein [Vibrio aerogenes]SHI24419.1 Bacterial transcription activator, effector binding domain [Vibrio aerogenes CECT 7868]